MKSMCYPTGLRKMEDKEKSTVSVDIIATTWTLVKCDNTS